MSRRLEANPLTPGERCREVAAILARGVLRLCRIARVGGNMPAPESSPEGRISLERVGETRLSVPYGTRGLRLRDDGDDA